MSTYEHWISERIDYYYRGLESNAICTYDIVDRLAAHELSRQNDAEKIDTLKRSLVSANAEIVNLKARLRSLQTVDNPNLMPVIELKTSPYDGVYFFQCEVSHHIKIGQSSNIKSRLSGIIGQCPTPLRLVGYLDDPRNDLEAYLHKRFMDANVHHEWFLPVPELLEYIKAIPYD